MTHPSYGSVLRWIAMRDPHFDPSCPAYEEAIEQLLQDGMIVPADGHYSLHPEQTLEQALAVADIVKR